jgi:hypothetical protein
MARSPNELIASLAPGEQAAIAARHQALKQDVAGLRELRHIAGKAQEDVANALNIKQPSVSKIEKQADMYLSTLRSYVEAVGGTLELTVALPERPTLKLHSLGDVGTARTTSARGVSRRRKQAAAR